jgi:hypothetical protein
LRDEEGGNTVATKTVAFVELEMKAAGIVDFGTDLRNPNFANLAEVRVSLV